MNMRLSIIVAALLLTNLSLYATNPPPNVNREVQYLIVTHSSYANFWNDEILKSNAALLITDTAEIADAQRYYLSKYSTFHFCGYDIETLFWISNDSLFGRRAINSQCETFGYKQAEASRQINHYKTVINSKPTHYIYNIEIPASLSPKTVRDELFADDFLVFAFSGDLERYPSLGFTFQNTCFVGEQTYNKTWYKVEEANSQETDSKMNFLIDSIKTRCVVLNEPMIYSQASGGFADSIYHKKYTELIFENSDDIESAKPF